MEDKLCWTAEISMRHIKGRKKMKSILVTVVCLTICTTLYPQSKTSNPKYALSFGITDNFSLDKFNMDIAVKKIFDEDHQLRVFLSPRFIRNENEIESQNGFGINDSEDVLTEYSLGIGVDYLWILKTSENINLFSGTGLSYSFGQHEEKSTTGNEYSEEMNTSSTDLGVRGTLGVEWKITEKIGIHSEYLFTTSYYWDKSETKYPFWLNEYEFSLSTTTSKQSKLHISTIVLFGISIYI